MAVLWINASDIADPTSPYAETAVEIASFMLYKLSGEKYSGSQTVTEWYGRDESLCFACGLGPGTEAAISLVGDHLHAGLRLDGTRRLLRLRGRPVVSVDTVETANGVLDAADYKIVNRTSLLKTSGCWTDAGVTVTYSYGAYPPAMGRMAAIRLANELVAMYEGSEDCALPDNVTSVTRQGLSFTLNDPVAVSAMRRTGIWEIDMFLATVNPDGARKRPKVFSPDTPRGERYN